MQARTAFALWPRLHLDVLELLARVPEGSLEQPLAAGAPSLGSQFRRLAALEEHWRRVVLERASEPADITPADCPGRESLQQRLRDTFAATEQLLAGSVVEALAERPVRSRYPVTTALEALSLAQIHTAHHRAGIAAGLRTLGIEPGEWL